MPSYWRFPRVGLSAAIAVGSSVDDSDMPLTKSSSASLRNTIEAQHGECVSPLFAF